MSEIELKACSETESSLTERATKQSAPKELWGRKLTRSERQCWAQGFNAAKPTQWQPISSAPKDGVFVVYMPEERRPMQVMYASGNGVCVVGGFFAFDLTKPTHWIPLPAPPEVEG